MVSLENKATYIERIKQDSPKLRAFYDFLSGTKIVCLPDEERNEADDLFFGIITSIQANDKNRFEQFYHKKSRSNPSKDSISPFVNDDFLIFSLLCGIIKFGLDKSWIRNVLEVRSQNATTITLQNILNENYNSKSTLPEVLLIYSQLINSSLTTDDLINEAYKNLSDNSSLFQSRDDFKILCASKAYDLIILLRTAPDENEIKLLKLFNQRFLKRVKTFSWITRTILIVSLLYGVVELMSAKPEIKSFFDKFNSALKMLGLFGISQLDNFFPFIKSRIYGFWLRVFGYPQSLTEDVIKKEAK